MDRCRISKWEVVLGALDRVNIPCLMHDTRCLTQVTWRFHCIMVWFISLTQVSWRLSTAGMWRWRRACRTCSPMLKCSPSFLSSSPDSSSLAEVSHSFHSVSFSFWFKIYLTYIEDFMWITAFCIIFNEYDVYAKDSSVLIRGMFC